MKILRSKFEIPSNTYYKSPLRTSRPSESAQASSNLNKMASPDYVTTARGYKVVYSAPEDFFSYEHCRDCAEGGDAVLMEEGECPRCGCLNSYKPYECCESCDREWEQAVFGRAAEPEEDYRAELREKSEEELREALAKLQEELPALAEDYSENGQKVLEDAMRWKAAYQEELESREQPTRNRDLIVELTCARSNYQSALMSDPANFGWDRMCSNFEDDVQEAEKALQEELWECDEARKELRRRSRAAGRGELNEEEQKEMDAMDEWAQRAYDALHPR
jgi:flagellar biosynthesis GTPase FlhF